MVTIRLIKVFMAQNVEMKENGLQQIFLPKRKRIVPDS